MRRDTQSRQLTSLRIGVRWRLLPLLFALVPSHALAQQEWAFRGLNATNEFRRARLSHVRDIPNLSMNAASQESWALMSTARLNVFRAGDVFG